MLLFSSFIYKFFCACKPVLVPSWTILGIFLILRCTNLKFCCVLSSHPISNTISFKNDCVYFISYLMENCFAFLTPSSELILLFRYIFCKLLELCFFLFLRLTPCSLEEDETLFLFVLISCDKDNSVPLNTLKIFKSIVSSGIVLAQSSTNFAAFKMSKKILLEKFTEFYEIRMIPSSRFWSSSW